MHSHSAGPSLDVILALPFVLAVGLYFGGAWMQHARGRGWPLSRSVAWLLGVLAAAAGFVGPLPAAGHTEFIAHMCSHLLVGMVAPVLLVVARPVTLALRSLHVRRARQLSYTLRGWPARILTLPIVAAGINVGGMWVLYRTPLYEVMQLGVLTHTVVMAHFLLAGLLFTAVVIPFDPTPHRATFPWRMGVLIAAIAAHNILAKMIYASPPPGVTAAEGQAGALLMYYGGDVVDAVLVLVLCAQWYRHTGRHRLRSAHRREVQPASP